MNTLNQNEYEVYCINLNTTPDKYKITKEKYLDILKHNLININGLTESQIVRKAGYSIKNFVIYHHHALFTDKKKFKIVTNI